MAALKNLKEFSFWLLKWFQNSWNAFIHCKVSIWKICLHEILVYDVIQWNRIHIDRLGCVKLNPIYLITLKTFYRYLMIKFDSTDLTALKTYERLFSIIKVLVDRLDYVKLLNRIYQLWKLSLKKLAAGDSWIFSFHDSKSKFIDLVAWNLEYAFYLILKDLAASNSWKKDIFSMIANSNL